MAFDFVSRCAKFEIFRRKLSFTAFGQNLAEEQQKLLNLARQLKLALNPELMPYSSGGIGAKITHINITKEQFQAKQWDDMNETALYALGPVSMDEYVIRKLNKESPILPFEHGVALVMFGKNTFGQSKEPKFAIYKRYTYSRSFSFKGSYGEARDSFYELTHPQVEGETAVHTREGNFTGGCFSDDAAHPNMVVGQPGLTPKPWILGQRHQVQRVESGKSPGSWHVLQRALSL